MHQKMGIKSNNMFFKTPRRPIISLSMHFLDIPPFPPLDSHFMERQQRKISVKPSIKNELKNSIAVYRSGIKDTGSLLHLFGRRFVGAKDHASPWSYLGDTVPPLSATRRSSMRFPAPRRKRQNKKAPAGAGAFYRSYMPNGQTIGMTTRQTMREITHIGTPTFA